MSKDSEPAEVVVLTLDFRQEAGQWLAECLELGTATFAGSLDEAQQELAEAVELHLNEVNRLGFIEEFLNDHGLKAVPIRPHATGTGQSWNLPDLITAP